MKQLKEKKTVQDLRMEIEARKKKQAEGILKQKNVGIKTVMRSLPASCLGPVKVSESQNDTHGMLY